MSLRLVRPLDRVGRLFRRRSGLGRCGAVLALWLGAAAIDVGPLRAARGELRTLELYNIHTKETSRILYKKDGHYIPAALEKVNWALRDWRRDEATKMDPKLLDLLWEVHRELGSKEPIHVISAYRSRNTNAMLRSTVGGQASESRHILGKAIDVHFPDVPIRQIRYSALIREQGGVGYYPTSALPFVHLDTDRVRAWPRLPRHELALLFPKGETQHVAADGGSIGPEDVRQAKSRYRDLAQEMATYHTLRTTVQRPGSTLVASAPPRAAAKDEPHSSASRTVAPAGPATAPGASGPPRSVASVPPLLEAPRVVDRPSTLTVAGSQGAPAKDRARFDALIAMAAAPPARSTDQPQLVGVQQPVRRGLGHLSPTGLLASGFAPDAPVAGVAEARIVAAPAFDDEHPDELAYRPFPIAPFMTLSASYDDPALAVMTHPNHHKTLELLDAIGGAPPMRLRPTERSAALMMAQSFQGDAINVHKAFAEPDGLPRPAGLTARAVATR